MHILFYADILGKIFILNLDKLLLLVMGHYSSTGGPRFATNLLSNLITKKELVILK